jgi:hypothetical protein
MQVNMTLVKKDHGMYDDSFHLTLESAIGEAVTISINETSYNFIKSQLNGLIKEEFTFPAQEREKLY